MSNQACRFEASWINSITYNTYCVPHQHRSRDDICDIGLAALRAELNDTVTELHEWESRAVDFKAQRDDQARVIARLMEAIDRARSEGLARHQMIVYNILSEALPPTPTEG